MRYIDTDKAPKAIGPYSQAIETDSMIFCSGQIGIDPTTSEVVEGLEAQVKQSLNNLKALVESAGGKMELIVKTTLFLTDMADFARVNAIYSTFFLAHKPARSTVAVVALPKGALFEIEAIVVK
ncbi:RidA family protein [soil metagenome]